MSIPLRNLRRGTSVHESDQYGACTNREASFILKSTIDATLQVWLEAETMISHFCIYDATRTLLGCVGGEGDVGFSGLLEPFNNRLRGCNEGVQRSF